MEQVLDTSSQVKGIDILKPTITGPEGVCGILESSGSRRRLSQGAGWWRRWRWRWRRWWRWWWWWWWRRWWGTWNLDKIWPKPIWISVDFSDRSLPKTLCNLLSDDLTLPSCHHRLEREGCSLRCCSYLNVLLAEDKVLQDPNQAMYCSTKIMLRIPNHSKLL